MELTLQGQCCYQRREHSGTKCQATGIRVQTRVKSTGLTQISLVRHWPHGRLRSHPSSDIIPQMLKDYASQGNVPPRLSGRQFFVSLVAPRSEVTTPRRAQMAGRADSEAPGRIPGNKTLIQRGTRGVQGYDRKISQVSKSEIQPPAPWGSASLQPRPQGPIPGRLEGDRSYFLLRVGELRCTVWAGEADFKLQGIWAKSCFGGGMRSSRLLWSRDTQPVPAA